MELTNRTTRITYIPGTGLLAGDVVGCIHLLDDNLRPLMSSPVTYAGQPIRDLTVRDRWVVGRDRKGGLAKWSLDNLDLTDYLDAGAMGGAAPAPFEPVADQRMTQWNDRVYISESCGTLTVLDAETFSVETVLRSVVGGGPIASLCTEHPSVHTLTDGGGRVFLGSLATMRFPTVSHLGDRRMRRIRYDARHDRFWVVGYDESAPFGLRHIVVLLTPDGAVEYEMPFSRFEPSFLEFSPDASHVYAGGAEGLLHVIDNTLPTPRLLKTVGGFPHQLTDLAVGGDGSLFVLTLSNELVRIDSDLDCVQAHAPVLRQGASDLAHAPDDESRIYCATDDGVSVLRVLPTDAGVPCLVEAERHPTRHGMTRRVVGLPGGYAAIGQKAVVFRADSTGKPLWSVSLDDAGFSLAASADHGRLLVGTGVGGIELEAATGSVVDRLTLDGVPLSAGAYGAAGERILGNQDGTVCAFAADSAEELWWLDTGEPVQRIWFRDGTVYLCGRRELVAFSPEEGVVTGRWVCACGVTAALVLGDLVHLACAEGELHTYDRPGGRPLGVVGRLPDLPRSLTALTDEDGRTHLVAGGRGGYLCTYALSPAGLPVRLRDTYLARRGGQSFPLPLEWA
ncbi:outer membrane protein assembly factor BamB family protein [Streptomyces sp. URMC 129]|uniref:outer membrane protein assembly factor BamB family protein n=1 Tax=Streptomyces sp. URMC 129 TaxID=3423407 RepID=UPI003F1D0C9C